MLLGLLVVKMMMAGRKADTRESQMVGSTEVMKVRKTVPKKENWKVHAKVERRVSQTVLSMDILMGMTMAQQKENWTVQPKAYAKEDSMIDRSDEQMETLKVGTMVVAKESRTVLSTGMLTDTRTA